MTASLQDRMEKVETRTDTLETILGQFIASTNKMVIRMENDTKQFKDEMKDFKDEMKEFKDEMKDFKDEMRRSRKEMDKKWGDLSNKLGTMVEDMVAPNIPAIARDYFGDDDFEFFGVRVWRRNMKERSIRREFDIIAVSDSTFFINETKSKPSPDDVKFYIVITEIALSFFSDNKKKKMVPIFSSLYLPEDITKNLTKRGIYAMGAKEGTMDLLNFEQVSERRTM